WALLAWSDRPESRRRAVVVGLACGVGLWTYQPLKLLPVLVALWLFWLQRADRAAHVRLREHLPRAVAADVGVAAPLAVAAVMDPTSYFGRGLTVSAANPSQGGIASLPTHTIDTLGMFGILGDPNARHDVGAAPLLPLLVTVLIVLGLWRAWRGRRSSPAM